MAFLTNALMTSRDGSRYLPTGGTLEGLLLECQWLIANMRKLPFILFTDEVTRNSIKNSRNSH